MGSNQYTKGTQQSGRVVVKVLALGSGFPLNCWALGKSRVSQDRNWSSQGDRDWARRELLDQPVQKFIL